MGRTHGGRTAALAALGMTLAGAMALGAQESDGRAGSRIRSERIDTSFVVGANGSLDVQMPHMGRGSADVEITGWGEGRVRVQGEASDGELSISVSGNHVEIGTRSQRGMTRVERLQVQVPYGTRIVISNGNGDIVLTGTRGPVEATSFNGDITVSDATDRLEIKAFNGDIAASNVNGRLTVRASNGDVELRGVRGEVDVNSLNGDIALIDITSRNVTARTMSGRITYDGTVERTGNYSFNAFSGSIDMAIPENTDATLSISTFSGTIDSPDFPLTLKPGARSRESKGQTMTFELGNGGARVSLESFSGEITIRERRADRRGD